MSDASMADEFLGLIGQFPNVRLVVFGHIHHKFKRWVNQSPE
ncbi:MAG: hypothetical protein AAFY17_06440 [Cyanobacteria bacterium J06642_11]